MSSLWRVLIYGFKTWAIGTVLSKLAGERGSVLCIRRACKEILEFHRPFFKLLWRVAASCSHNSGSCRLTHQCPFGVAVRPLKSQIFILEKLGVLVEFTCPEGPERVPGCDPCTEKYFQALSGDLVVFLILSGGPSYKTGMLAIGLALPTCAPALI